MKGSAPGLSIRARLILLVLAAVLPLFLFSAALLQRSYRLSAGLIEDTAMGTARQLSLAIDAEVGRAQAVLLALGESPLLDAADLAAFEDLATRALVANGLDGQAMLARADGSKVAHTLSVPGQSLPPLNDQAGLHRLFATGQPQVSGVYTGQITHESQVAVHVPVYRDGEVRFDAVASLSVRSLTQVLQSHDLPEGWWAGLSDRAGRTIARTLTGASEVGAPVSAGLATLSASAEEGFGPILSREGMPVFAGFTHTKLTGWMVSIAVPEAVVRGPRLRSIAALAGGAAALLLATIGLAWLIGRHIARPVHALANEAARLGRNELPDPAATKGVAEAEAAGQALHAAGLLLAARAEEREAALQRAEESEARLLLAQEAGQIGAWETDCATGQRTWSPQQYLLYGIHPSAGPPHGPAWAALIHPDDRSKVLATVARAYGAPLSYQHEFRIVPAAGSVRWVRSAGRSVFRDGKPSRLLGVTVDATERHEAEQRLRDGAARLEAEVAARTGELAESERRFRTYFEYSADALLVVRVEDGRFTYETLNPAGERLTGYRHADIVGHSPEEVLLPETASVVLDSYRKVAASGAPLRLEQSLALPTGTLELETVLVPVRETADGPVVRILSGQRDLTEQRRLEARLSHAQRMEAVGQLTGGVAHDFNNLLTVVVGNLSLLRRRLHGDEKAVRYLNSVEQAAERGAKLTASLLVFSRRQTLHVAPLDVGALLAESTTLLHRALGEAVTLELDVTPGLPLATADAAQLEAAVLNLVINARDAIMDSPAREGSVHVQVRPAVLRESELEGNDEAKPGRFVSIAVQDTGMGMPPEVRARAFEPFFTTKEVGRGTGLGLSQVFGFVRQLGGHVTLDSTPGHGTKAVLFLPVAESLRREAAEAAVPAQTLPADAVVLVVEDDDGIREVTAEVLRDAGLTILVAANVPAALNTLRSGVRVDAIFSDVVMPGGATGVDLARAAKALRPDVSVLLTSGYGGPALSRYGAEGEYEVLAKPYTRTALLERLGQMLAGRAPG